MIKNRENNMSLLSEIKETRTPFGTAAAWWLGQMVLIVKMGETVVCIDYFASPDSERRTPPVVPVEEVEGITAFLGTHDHLDHIDHEAWKIWARNCPDSKFVFPRAHKAKILADGISEHNALGMNDGESLQIGDITIHAVAASHEFLDQDQETGLFPYLQYVLEGNGVRIHHAGDTVRYEGMLAKIRAFGPIDAQLLPINGRDAVRYRRNCIGNMTYQEAADFAFESGARLVIPGHFDMFENNSENPGLFADYLEAKYKENITCKIPIAGKRII